MRLTRRRLLEAAGAAAVASALPPLPGGRALAAGWDDAAYWAFADAMQELFPGRWSAAGAHYTGGGGGETSMNANLLFTHATAALHGHEGACRQDERARALALRLCQSPPYRKAIAVAAKDQTHPHGWGNSLNALAGQHAVIDAAVVRALAQALIAREALQLPEATARVVADRVRAAAYCDFYEYPQMRLNQINWPIEIYAHAARALGEPHLLRHDMRLQLERFAWHLVHTDADHPSAFTGPGYRFHYLPQFGEDHRFNLDSAEYANIVCGALRFYEQGLAAGMRPLDPAHLRRLRAWVERVLCGYWTHGGYLNWDTGLGFRRWHQSKKLGLSQASLLAIATSRTFQPAPAYGRWAKWTFDRGLELYSRIAAETRDVPPAVLFGVTATQASAADPRLALSRMQANAVLAAELGLGVPASEPPPPLYAYDPDIGRLAVTTPRYNAAILAANQGAVPYGGVELARLFDGDQRVAASVGGVPPASFGLTLVDEVTGRRRCSQRAHRRDRRRPPLRLVRAPRRGTEPYPRHAYAGPFREIEAAGSTRVGAAVVHTRHRFRSRSIDVEWRILPRDRRHPHSVRATFPTTAPGAAVAVLLDGSRVPVTRAWMPLAPVVRFELSSGDSGYAVEPGRAPAGARARVLRPLPQPTAPEPGPLLVVELTHRRRLRPMGFRVRIRPGRPA